MKVYELAREQLVPQPLERVFAFFAKPGNLESLTPKSLGFEILTPPPLEMRAGAIIDYTLNVIGLPLHWRTLIETYDPPHRFVDIQLEGPYKFWHHTHTFVAQGQSTLIQDRVRYALPFGWFGRLANLLFIRRQLATIFGFRARFIGEKFGRVE